MCNHTLVHVTICTLCVTTPQAIGGEQEAVQWLGVQHRQKEALEIFASEIAPAGTGMCEEIVW